MTDRIPLDHLTSDALDALYERLNDAEKVIAHLEDGEKLRLRAETELADLREQLRLTDSMRQQNLDAAAAAIQRADRAEAEIAACRRQAWPKQLAAAEATIERIRRYEQQMWDVEDSREMPVSAVSHAVANDLHHLLNGDHPAPAPAATQTTDT